jgi:hypothetical protein
MHTWLPVTAWFQPGRVLWLALLAGALAGTAYGFFRGDGTIADSFGFSSQFGSAWPQYPGLRVLFVVGWALSGAAIALSLFAPPVVVWKVMQTRSRFFQAGEKAHRALAAAAGAARDADCSQARPGPAETPLTGCRHTDV